MDGIGRHPTPRRIPRSSGRVLLIVCAVLLAGLALPAWADTPARRVGAGPAAARTGWTPAVPVVDPGCHPDLTGTAAAAASGGTVHGFAHYATGGFSDCRDDRAWYFQGRRSRWTQSRSPYQGEVLAAAADRAATYLLYLGRGPGGRFDQILLGKRLHHGRYLPPRLLSRLEGTAVNTSVQGAALVAAGGKWWAVWAQALHDPNSEVPPPMLFQAKTIGGAQATRQITFRPDQNTLPALALTRDGHGRVTGALLAWSNGVFVPSRQGGFNVENDDIRLARAGLSGRWSSHLVSRGTYDLQVNANLVRARRGHLPGLGSPTPRWRPGHTPGAVHRPSRRYPAPHVQNPWGRAEDRRQGQDRVGDVGNPGPQHHLRGRPDRVELDRAGGPGHARPDPAPDPAAAYRLGRQADRAGIELGGKKPGVRREPALNDPEDCWQQNRRRLQRPRLDRSDADSSIDAL
jgi:hypothetical protein